MPPMFATTLLPSTPFQTPSSTPFLHPTPSISTRSILRVACTASQTHKPILIAPVKPSRSILIGEISIDGIITLKHTCFVFECFSGCFLFLSVICVCDFCVILCVFLFFLLFHLFFYFCFFIFVFLCFFILFFVLFCFFFCFLCVSFCVFFMRPQVRQHDGRFFPCDFDIRLILENFRFHRGYVGWFVVLPWRC